MHVIFEFMDYGVIIFFNYFYILSLWEASNII